MTRLTAPEFTLENEVAIGLPQREIILTYALAIRQAAAGEEIDWKRMDRAILAKWPKALDRIKAAALKRAREL